MPRAILRFPALLLAVLLAACATAGNSSRAAGGDVVVRVDNNLIPPAALTVYMVSETGTRRLIGNVSPQQNATLSFDPLAASGRYRLVARTTAGAEIASTPFTLTTGDAAVNWDLRSNIATVGDVE